VSPRTPERSLWARVSQKYPPPPYTTSKVQAGTRGSPPETVDPMAHSGSARDDGIDQSPQARRTAISHGLVEDFARGNYIHEVRFPGVPETVFIVSTAAEGELLVRRQQISRGRIWTARELADVLLTTATSADFTAIALAKVVFDGEIVSRGEG
jgi:hypothetical protein